MTAAGHDELSALLGPAALGALGREERARLDRHLRECADCRSELQALVGVTSRLAALDLDDVLPERPSAAADAVLSAIAGERRAAVRRQRRATALLAAAASTVVLVAGTAAAVALGGSGAPAVPREDVPVQASAAVTARAAVVPHTWGVEIELQATGFAEGRPYSVQVRRRDGRLTSAGTFVGTGERPMLCSLNSSVLRADAVGFVVLDAQDRPVLSGTLPQA